MIDQHCLFLYVSTNVSLISDDIVVRLWSRTHPEDVYHLVDVELLWRCVVGHWHSVVPSGTRANLQTPQKVSNT